MQHNWNFVFLWDNTYSNMGSDVFSKNKMKGRADNLKREILFYYLKTNQI